MKFIRSEKPSITFEKFLSGTFARDYVMQDADYEAQIAEAVTRIREADYVLLGAGAGMSTAAGAEYGGKFFEEHFGEFQEAYGKQYMQDMYTAGFYPFRDEESRWALWCHLALTAGADLDVTPLHKTLLDALAGKKIFLLSTNADHQFGKAGLPAEQIFETQGSYDLIQCQRGCHRKTYNAVSMFRQMDQARQGGTRIPQYMVPKCPVCGGPMAMNLRCDNHFVQDDNWYAAEKQFSAFLSEAMDRKLVLLELGVGFNTPTIIRFPFEKLTREHENISLIRLSRSKAMVPASLGGRAIGINADMAQSIADIAAALKEEQS